MTVHRRVFLYRFFFLLSFQPSAYPPSGERLKYRVTSREIKRVFFASFGAACPSVASLSLELPPRRREDEQGSGASFVFNAVTPSLQGSFLSPYLRVPTISYTNKALYPARAGENRWSTNNQRIGTPITQHNFPGCKSSICAKSTSQNNGTRYHNTRLQKTIQIVTYTTKSHETNS